MKLSSFFLMILVWEVFHQSADNNHHQALAWPWSSGAADEPPTPPTEPDYTYISPDFDVQELGDCVDGSRVWLYTPSVPKPTVGGGGADVVVYLHGYLAAFPSVYEAHIHHIVKQGNYVIFPQFQQGLCEPDGHGKLLFGLKAFLGRPSSPVEWADRAVERVQDVLLTLMEYNRVYLYGHSLGGAMALMWGKLTGTADTAMDVTAAVLASPQPGGFAAIPGFVTSLFSFFFGEDIDVPAAAPDTMFPVAILHGNDDTVAPLTDVMPSYDALGSFSKAIYQAQSDSHGTPALTADHLTALTGSPRDVNNLDWRYFWSALDQVMVGTSVTAIQFDMGSWSDGVNVQVVKQLA